MDSFGCVLMVLVALQVGLQPAVTKACVKHAVSGQSLVLAEMGVSVGLALALVPRETIFNWSPMESIRLAGPPAAVYALRSWFKQAAYRLCDGVTFNVLNQTKVVFCALAAWVLLGEGQTRQQCEALFCALVAGSLLVCQPRHTAAGKAAATSRLGRGHSRIALHGCCRRKWGGPSFRCNAAVLAIHPVCIARDAQTAGSGGCANVAASTCASGAGIALATAGCSGLAAALSQSAMAGSARPSTLFNLELAFWGLPLVALGCPRGGLRRIFADWQLLTLAPVVLQAAGGLLVSALVKQHGGVAMGLCSVAGIGVSVVVDAVLTKRLPTSRQICAAMLCVLSVAAHQHGAR